MGVQRRLPGRGVLEVAGVGALHIISINMCMSHVSVAMTSLLYANSALHTHMLTLHG